jgi:hypothetical protein
MSVLTRRSWSPYVAGALAGLLLVLSVLATGKYFGASTTFVRSAGLIEQVFVPERVESMDYFIKTKVKIDWQWMFVFGVLFGSFIASRMGRDFRATPVPPMWQAAFGANRTRRWTVAFLGGIILMFGARLAGG